MIGRRQVKVSVGPGNLVPRYDQRSRSRDVARIRRKSRTDLPGIVVVVPVVRQNRIVRESPWQDRPRRGWQDALTILNEGSASGHSP
jgi:hypothetical protein